ncbi:hypothetical protein PHLGIDRAFT_34058 [Phlebiopsis gigantea 11061_1 CR5-6]|uniref:Uncharacterized protein n=1 Tax=Phlebiopsis gigantea (strain 11061_1 CR5-6) TaxID=745531 RepID=A0A0C3PS06_PHLG1|nr:hypothetical protein PHLGIDRAFT_34058 [Phlebiopsis gigantea 11061_1 CR5-6]
MSATGPKTSYAFVDDQSPRITYDGPWFNELQVENAWNNTLSLANSSGSSATFKFNGNRVGVLGFVFFEDEANAPISQYQVDDSSPSTFQPTKQQNGSEVTFFLSPLLADGDHTLILELASNGAPFFIDAIAYNMSSQPSTTSGASQPTIVTTVIETPSSTASSSGHTSSGSSDLVGPIVGGVVGGITLITCAWLAFYFLYWKRTRRRALYQYHTTSTHDDWDSDTKPFRGSYGPPPRKSVFPYATAYPPPPPSSTRSVSVYSTADFPQFPSPEPSPRAPSRQTSYAASAPDTASSYSSSAPSASSASSRGTVLTLVGAGTAPLRIAPKADSKKALEAGAGDAERAVQQHEDSGLRFDVAGPSGTSHDDGADKAAVSVPEELPPGSSKLVSIVRGVRIRHVVFRFEDNMYTRDTAANKGWTEKAIQLFTEGYSGDSSDTFARSA